MEKRMIRCVSIKPDKKTGQYAVKFLSESVVNNRFFMKKYGWRVEEVKEEVKPDAIEETPVETQDLNLAEVEEFAEVPEPEFIEETPEETKAAKQPKKETPAKATRAKRKTTKQ